MKKLFLLLSIVSIVFTSCSSDDSDDEPTTEGYLIKKIIKTSTSGTSAGTFSTVEFFYDGNKLINEISSNGYSSQYTYTGELITRIDNLSNNVVNQSDYFLYDSQQRVIEHKSILGNNIARRSDFIYNSDGTVSIKIYTGNHTVQNNLDHERKVFFYPNGDVEKIERYLVINGNNVTKTDTFTYDSMSATGSVILGVPKLKLWDLGASGSSHNILSSTSTTTENSGSFTVDFTYTYNSFGFPKTSTDPGNIYQLFYQQP